MVFPHTVATKCPYPPIGADTSSRVVVQVHKVSLQSLTLRDAKAVWVVVSHGAPNEMESLQQNVQGSYALIDLSFGMTPIRSTPIRFQVFSSSLGSRCKTLENLLGHAVVSLPDEANKKETYAVSLGHGIGELHYSIEKIEHPTPNIHPLYPLTDPWLERHLVSRKEEEKAPNSPPS